MDFLLGRNSGDDFRLRICKRTVSALSNSEISNLIRGEVFRSARRPGRCRSCCPRGDFRECGSRSAWNSKAGQYGCSFTITEITIGTTYRNARQPLKYWRYLCIAILAEVLATSSLKSSEGFTRLWPWLATIAGYGVAFYFLSLTLKTIPVGVAYAIWSGVGIVVIALIAWLAHGQKLDLAALVGMGLIMTGVILINGF